mmetsp:Transcript_5314/g.12694  ORF Transcript_5314/g.12694 Transcript_5314/m.12694 type:complete len:202 (-) Transcript_5314:646-1251(-)
MGDSPRTSCGDASRLETLSDVLGDASRPDLDECPCEAPHAFRLAASRRNSTPEESPCCEQLWELSARPQLVVWREGPGFAPRAIPPLSERSQVAVLLSSGLAMSPSEAGSALPAVVGREATPLASAGAFRSTNGALLSTTPLCTLMIGLVMGRPFGPSRTTSRPTFAGVSSLPRSPSSLSAQTSRRTRGPLTVCSSTIGFT